MLKNTCSKINVNFSVFTNTVLGLVHRLNAQGKARLC